MSRSRSRFLRSFSSNLREAGEGGGRGEAVNTHRVFYRLGCSGAKSLGRFPLSAVQIFGFYIYRGVNFNRIILEVTDHT